MRQVTIGALRKALLITPQVLALSERTQMQTAKKLQSLRHYKIVICKIVIYNITNSFPGDVALIYAAVVVGTPQSVKRK